ncbi:MAG: 4Fe-4S binding protein [bacterium]|jgi:NADH-quinone oxidoreductase subunit F
MPRLNSIAELEIHRAQVIERQKKQHKVISLCAGTGCEACGCKDVHIKFVQELNARNLSIPVKLTGCHGFCERGPIVIIRPANTIYFKVRPRDCAEIIETSIVGSGVVDRLCYTDENGKPLPDEHDVPFYKDQMRIVFGLNGLVDPMEIDDYIAQGGYSALAKVLSGMAPKEVIEEIKTSGLRGRGGGGFPTGRKWETCANAKGEKRFVICNADEGDPGAFMDRSILEGNPHSVLEGMLIAAYAIGSRDGFIYVRHEYPKAVRTFANALAQAGKYGLLGNNILGTDLSFEVGINRGGGAFVCGESTALMASLEGRVGEPRAKYIHTVEHGLYNLPSNLNNVETYATVPHIINNGADWFTKLGTKGSPGTKVFSLVGKVNNTGLIEVPMGITLREIIYGIGGGIQKNKAFKAVQTGGPSGGLLPEGMLDLPVDFDKLWDAGSMMGSGGMIVIDENSCVVNIARFFLNFLKDESCGKCIPCREGIRYMMDILERIERGEGKMEDIDTLEEMAHTVADTSLCGLGSSAPNPVLSSLTYFKDEYIAHIQDKKCPAGICKELIQYLIIPELCNGCDVCAKLCPTKAITGKKDEVHVIDTKLCEKCGACLESCPSEAIVRR